MNETVIDQFFFIVYFFIFILLGFSVICNYYSKKND
jgi:hypothetical protein